MNLRPLMCAVFACLLVLAFGCGEDGNGNGEDRVGPINYSFDSALVADASYELNLSIDFTAIEEFSSERFQYKLKLDVDFSRSQDQGILAVYTVKEGEVAQSGELLTLSRAVGMKVRLSLDENGQPGESSGIDALHETMLEEMDDKWDEYSSLSVSAWENVVSSLYAPTSPNQLYVGDEWKDKREGLTNLTLGATYSLASVDGALARVEFDETLSYEDISDILREEGIAAFTGALNGSYTVDTETGLAVGYEESFNYEIENVFGDSAEVMYAVSAELTRK